MNANDPATKSLFKRRDTEHRLDGAVVLAVSILTHIRTVALLQPTTVVSAWCVRSSVPGHLTISRRL